MNNAQQIIEELQLLPHPEGGWFKEEYRSEQQIEHNGSSRGALTTIFFLLEENQLSRWHEVDADEVWHFYEGDTLELLVAPPDFSRVDRILLNDITQNEKPVFVVPAGWWQAARTTGKFSLVGCTVAPAFQFSGFRFLRDEEKVKMNTQNPGFEEFC
jgi:hypothetical protein